MSPGSDGPTIQYDNINQAIAALGLGRPENPDGTVGPRNRRPHQSVKPKGGFTVGQNVRGGPGPNPKRRVVPKAPPIVEQAPYDEYEEPLPDYLDPGDYQASPTEDSGYPSGYRPDSEPTTTYQGPLDFEGSKAVVNIELEVPISQLRRLLDAIG